MGGGAGCAAAHFYWENRAAVAARDYSMNILTRFQRPSRASGTQSTVSGCFISANWLWLHMKGSWLTWAVPNFIQKDVFCPLIDGLRLRLASVSLIRLRENALASTEPSGRTRRHFGGAVSQVPTTIYRQRFAVFGIGDEVFGGFDVGDGVDACPKLVTAHWTQVHALKLVAYPP